MVLLTLRDLVEYRGDEECQESPRRAGVNAAKLAGNAQYRWPCKEGSAARRRRPGKACWECVYPTLEVHNPASRIHLAIVLLPTFLDLARESSPRLIVSSKEPRCETTNEVKG